MGKKIEKGLEAKKMSYVIYIELHILPESKGLAARNPDRSFVLRYFESNQFRKNDGFGFGGLVGNTICSIYRYIASAWNVNRNSFNGFWNVYRHSFIC